MQSYGRPGSHASMLASRATLHSLAFVAGVVVSLGAFLFLGAFSALGSSGVKSILAVASLIAAGYSSYQVSQFWNRSQKAQIGARSEKQVGKILEKSGAAAVVHGAMLGAGGDADHVVLGPVLAVIETKTGHGIVKTDSEGVMVGQRRVLGNPLRQAKRQAAALRSQSGAGWVDAIVCIPGMKNRPFESNGVWVCGAPDLPSVLQGLPRVLTTDQAVSIAEKIKP